MTKITIKYANGNEDYFITRAEDDIEILQLLKEIVLTFKNVSGFNVEKEKQNERKTI